MPLTRAFTRTLFGALVLSGGAAACLGVDDDYSIPFSGGGPALFDASAAQFVPACGQVEEGDPCGNDELTTECEVPGSANIDCNGVYQCDSANVWVATASGVCAPESACPAVYTETNPSGCTIAEAAHLICEYDDGTCGCAPVQTSDAGLDAGDAGDAGDAEAGVADAGDAGTTYAWRCIHADHDAGCPRKRPRTGAECVRPLSCDYGVCVFEDGVEMDCYAGYWTATVTTRSSECR